MTAIIPSSTHPLTVPADPRADVEGYLKRLGLDRPARPDLEWLFAAHRAHVERVPYETVELHLERPTTVDPIASTDRIVSGRGGYCFHLNGAFGTLLATLGYEVTRHIGDVDPLEDASDLDVNHSVLLVRCEGETWFVDPGLIDAPYEPMPLRAGTSVQGPFTYSLEPSPTRPETWRFVHDPLGLFDTMEFALEPVTIDAFADAHQYWSTSPESGFVRFLSVGRQDDSGVDLMRGLFSRRVDAAGVSERTVEDRGEWFAVLADDFGLELTDVDEDARAKLWARVNTAHEQLLAARARAQAEAQTQA